MKKDTIYVVLCAGAFFLTGCASIEKRVKAQVKQDLTNILMTDQNCAYICDEVREYIEKGLGAK